MKLIGVLDSPFVRRTAIALSLLDIDFEHVPLSVFSDFEKFRQLSPITKAPTLIFDDGTRMLDSSLILQLLETQSDKSLWASDFEERRAEARIVSTALAACEKSAQSLYERRLRPEDRQHGPWIERLNGQRTAAYSALEAEVADAPGRFASTSHASITAAIAFQFGKSELGEEVSPSDYPRLHSLHERMEALPVFQEYPPVGPGV